MSSIPFTPVAESQPLAEPDRKPAKELTLVDLATLPEHAAAWASIGKLCKRIAAENMRATGSPYVTHDPAYYAEIERVRQPAMMSN